MSYEVKVVNSFKKDVKKLFKKYRSIKSDILKLVERLEKDYTIGIDLGSNLYKVRLRNSDVGGKRGGYRIIYYTRLANGSIYLLTIYSKNQKESIDIKSLKPLVDKIEED